MCENINKYKVGRDLWQDQFKRNRL